MHRNEILEHNHKIYISSLDVSVRAKHTMCVYASNIAASTAGTLSALWQLSLAQQARREALQ
jgi:hypothetical protein